jgi:2-polyprenyl-3-methyl-5-hydroxy-6-metoxy-1,4-benzoquinol methylase
MKQNKYDDSGFFANYSQMPRSIGGLDAAGEWASFRTMLPELRDKKVLDLGCGFGWHCRYVREQQARSVVGVDLSENMLERARAITNDSEIEYRRLAIEDIDFAAGEFDVVISSLALHYVDRFDVICRKVHHCLVSEGTFVFSAGLHRARRTRLVLRSARREITLACRQLPYGRSAEGKISGQ